MNLLLPSRRAFIDHAGRMVFMGNRDEPIRGDHPVYGETPETRLVPRSEWARYCDPERLDHPALDKIGVADQGQIGMCNAAATAKAVEFMRACEGLPHVELSAGDLYGRICGGKDQGSTLEDGLIEASDGIASTNTCPYQQWQRSNQFAAAERKRYAAIERYLCPTFDHCFSAVLEGFALISGIPWYDSYEPDADGWLPAPGGQWGGHAIFGYAPALRAGEFGIGHLQSWGLDGVWGRRKGRFVVPESAYTRAIGGWWAVRQTTTEPQETPAPAWIDSAEGAEAVPVPMFA